jgi:benzoate-CoA ligase family protein
VTANACDYLVDRHVREGRGDRPALRYDGQVLSYQELYDLAASVHGGLAAAGVDPGDRVLFVCTDRPELLAGLLGAWRLGAIAVPVSTMLTAPELAGILDDAGAQVLVVSPEFTAVVEGALALAQQLPQLLVTVGPAALTSASTTWEDLLQPGPDAAVETAADDQALWLYTSGTTGKPKGAMHRHGGIRAACEAYGLQVLEITGTDVCFSVAKVFFAYGLGNSVLFPLSVGATTVLAPERPTAQTVARVLREEQPTLFFGSPTFYAALLGADLPSDLFASVRLCLSAGEALPPTLHARFTERFGTELLDGIGSTEALHIFLSNHAGDVRPGTSGKPVTGYDIELRDGEGRPVADGEPGSLFVRGASLATGYWQRPDATEQVFQGDWLGTGDTYVRTPDGYYQCLGRSNDLIKAGGIWVSPAEVEERLLQHPSVAEVVVVGVLDTHGLEKPVAYVVPRAGQQVDPAVLEAWCRETLAAFKRPREFVALEALPKTATGKVQRYRLRELGLERRQAVGG